MRHSTVEFGPYNFTCPLWADLRYPSLKLSCPALTTQISVFQICCFEMIRHHKSFTNHFSGVRMILIICFQNRLGFNRPDFSPVSTLFSKHILPKTSDFPFWNPLFKYFSFLFKNFRRKTFFFEKILCGINRATHVDVPRYQVFCLTPSELGERSREKKVLFFPKSVSAGQDSFNS